MHHTFIHAHTPTHNLWFWPKRPPLAFSMAEMSVAEMSGPKRPRPKCPWPKCPTFFLYRNIHSLQDCLALQEDLTSLGQWEANWQMKFNVAKCLSMRVTRHQHHKQILFDYSLHNQTLENVQSAKYLGITITDNMDWGQHVSETSSKATKTLGFLRRNLAFAPRSTKEVAYKTLVWPKLEYAAPIWSPHSKLQNNQIEKDQRTAALWTCRRWRNTSSVGVMLGELEWPSLEARRDQTSLFLFHKIHCGAVFIEKDKYIWALLTD